MLFPADRHTALLAIFPPSVQTNAFGSMKLCSDTIRFKGQETGIHSPEWTESSHQGLTTIPLLSSQITPRVRKWHSWGIPPYSGLVIRHRNKFTTQFPQAKRMSTVHILPPLSQGQWRTAILCHSALSQQHDHLAFPKPRWPVSTQEEIKSAKLEYLVCRKELPMIKHVKCSLWISPSSDRPLCTRVGEGHLQPRNKDDNYLAYRQPRSSSMAHSLPRTTSILDLLTIASKWHTRVRTHHTHTQFYSAMRQ